MLMTVLRGDLAVRQSKALVRTFKRMKDHIVENQALIGQREYIQLSLRTNRNMRDVMELRSELDAVEGKVADVIDSLGEVITESELSDIFNEDEKRSAFEEPTRGFRRPALHRRHMVAGRDARRDARQTQRNPVVNLHTLREQLHGSCDCGGIAGSGGIGYRLCMVASYMFDWHEMGSSSTCARASPSCSRSLPRSSANASSCAANANKAMHTRPLKRS